MTFDDHDDTVAVEGEQKGRGAYQFTVRKDGGGTVVDAEVDVEGGGQNALLTISDSECVGEVYWQVDFGVGLSPPDPPNYEVQQFIMAAVGDSDGVSFNPSCVFPKENIELVERAFTFDDENEPTNVAVTFKVTGSEDLHLAAFTRPPENLTETFDE